MACVTLAQEDEICIVNSEEEADHDDQTKLKNYNLIDIETGDDNTVNKMMHMDLKMIYNKCYGLIKFSLIWINRKLWYEFSSTRNAFICRNYLINIA